MEKRFTILTAKSLIELTLEMNIHQDKIGRIIYLGENKFISAGNVVASLENPFIAIFDNSPVFVATIEDLEELNNFQSDSATVSLDNVKIKTVISA